MLRVAKYIELVIYSDSSRSNQQPITNILKDPITSVLYGRFQSFMFILVGFVYLFLVDFLKTSSKSWAIS